MVVGVNRYVEEEAEPIELHRLDPEAERRQLERTARVRAERNAADAEAALAEVRRVAQGTDNLLPPMREALRARARSARSAASCARSSARTTRSAPRTTMSQVSVRDTNLCRFRNYSSQCQAQCQALATRRYADAPEYQRSPKPHHQRANANSAAAKPSASATVVHSSRDVTASAGTVIANAIGTMNVTPMRSQPG